MLYSVCLNVFSTAYARKIPKDRTKNSEETENLIRWLCNCDESSLEVIKATAKALIETAATKTK